MNWQTERKFSARAFKNLIDLWEISQAGMGRFLGRSERTIRRWVRGEIKIPAAESLLLNSMLAHNEKPIIPKWKRGDS